MDDRPPPPPPHGERPKGSGLPPGKYDIFVIPEHSAGSGFLYLPSLQPNINSFVAGFATALILVVLGQSMAPAFRTWWESFQGIGDMGIAMLIIGVGFGAWSLGRTQQQGSSSAGSGSGSSGGHSRPGASGSFGSGSFSGSAPPPGADGPPPPPPPHGHQKHTGHAGGGAPPPRGSTHHAGYGYEYDNTPPRPTPPPRSPPTPPPRSPTPPPPPPPPPPPREETPPPPPPRSEPPPTPKEEKTRPPPPKPEPQAQPKPPPQPQSKPQPPPQPAGPSPEEVARRAREQTAKSSWEKARAETKKREEERKLKEAEQKRREQAAQRLAELRAKEAKERQAREVERQRKEKEAKDAQDRRDAEARAKELAEKLEQERKERERLEKEVKEREEARRKEREEEEARKKKEKEEEEASTTRRGGGYAYSGVGERISMWPNGRPPMPAKSTTGSTTSQTTAQTAQTAQTSQSKKPPAPSARTYVSAEDSHSYRPYDKAKKPTRKKSASSLGSESSWAQSHTTSRTSPPPSMRGTYATKDPDKIVISAVYLFMNQFAKTPASQLVSGIGSVTDGLILRITTEGLFIDDDVRGVPQREWDVKAWTLKSCETGEWKAKGLHILRATLRDQEAKRYLFVVDEMEAWKVTVGLQRLQRGAQIRQVRHFGISGMPASEARGTLEMLGWGT